MFSAFLLARHILHPPRYHRWIKCSQPSSISEGMCVGQSLLQPHAPLFTSGCVSVLGLQSALWLWSYRQNRHVCMGSGCDKNYKFQVFLFFFFFKQFWEKNSLQAFCSSFSWICITLHALFLERQRVYQHSIDSVHDWERSTNFDKSDQRK